MSNLRTIHKTGRYIAFDYKNGAGLIVQRASTTQGGKHLTGAQAGKWINAIETAIDNKEADQLCRAILKGG